MSSRSASATRPATVMSAVRWLEIGLSCGYLRSGPAILDSRRHGGVTAGTQRDEICAYSSIDRWRRNRRPQRLLRANECVPLRANRSCNWASIHAIAVFGRITIQHVEANPQSSVVRRADAQTQPIGVICCPRSCAVLSIRLDDAPRMVRPPAIVRGGGLDGGLVRHSAVRRDGG